METNKVITEHVYEKALAIMAHDIKAPLAASVSILDIISKGYVEEPGKIKELVARAIRKNETIIAMVNDILDYTLLVDKSKMKREKVQLSDIFAESISTMKSYVAKRNISLTYSPDIGLNKYVNGNYTFLLRAFNNIIMNAIKYNKEGGNISVQCRQYDDEPVISIIFQDTGIGIPSDEVAKVFNIFERGRFARKNINGSLGLGLSLVKQIIDDHEGDIKLSSTVDVGTTITLTLPLLKIRQVKKEGQMNHKILVVEDDIDVLEARQVVLEHNNYEVVTATTIDVAKELLNKNTIDLILLDVMMEKDSDGFMFAQYVKGSNEFKHIPIIMITAVNQRTKFRFDVQKDGDFLPVEKFMEKPVDPDDLIVTIRGLLK